MVFLRFKENPLPHITLIPLIQIEFRCLLKLSLLKIQMIKTV